MVFGLASCSHGDGPKFHVLSADGEWVGHDGSVLPNAELLLEADADGNGMLRGDTIKAAGWSSKKDGSGEAYADGATGDWWAKYEVVKCTVWFSAGAGGDDPEPATADASGSWKVAEPAAPASKKHFRAIWCKDSELTQPFDFANDVIGHSITLYAGWESPLCLTALADGCSVTLKKNGEPGSVLLEYSTDGGESWDDYVPGTTGGAISLDTGESVYFAAKTSNAGFSTSTSAYYQFDFGSSADKKVAASGNIMSLLDGTLALKDLSEKDYAFYSLFKGCKSLASAPDLPATTLAANCYYSMFSGCTSLASAPALSAETLAGGCYSFMFGGCTSLASAPELPAETLAASCYQNMFNGCTSLMSAPVLPAETLADSCYYNMFYGCTNLGTAPALPSETLAASCYNSMFGGCTSLASAPELPAETLTYRCYGNMFSGCTNLGAAPELPAMQLAEGCYECMFENCTSLTAAPELPAETAVKSCYSCMFSHCQSIVTAPLISAGAIVEDCYYQMFYDCKSLSDVTVKLTAWGDDETDTFCWMDGVKSMGTFHCPAGLDKTKRGENYIPSGWTIDATVV